MFRRRDGFDRRIEPRECFGNDRRRGGGGHVQHRAHARGDNAARSSGPGRRRRYNAWRKLSSRVHLCLNGESWIRLADGGDVATLFRCLVILRLAIAEEVARAALQEPTGRVTPPPVDS
jgi:hypothetical protein